MFAKDCWKCMGLEFDTSKIESCPGWLLKTLGSEARDKVVRMIMILGIWNARNMRVWDSKIVPPELAMQWSVKQITQWQEVQVQKVKTVNVQICQADAAIRWLVPVAGGYKVNVDASVFARTSSFSIGMVLRDHVGGFCTARNLRKGAKVTVFEAEARGVLEAIRWIMEMGITNVVVECDSLLVVQSLNKGVANLLEVGNILGECDALIGGRPDISISFVKKQANKVAHLLAFVS